MKGATKPLTRYIVFKPISIHAPAKGATSPFMVSIAGGMNFNPRSREGSDFDIVTFSILHNYFNPRSREGSDISVVIDICHKYNFNPRSREGSDLSKTFTNLLCQR